MRRPLRPGRACLAWGSESHQCGWSSRDGERDVRPNTMAGPRWYRHGKEAGFTQSAVGSRRWTLQRVEGNFARLSIPTLLQNIVVYRGESLFRSLLGMMPSVTRDPTI